jgi:hypothetical protein
MTFDSIKSLSVRMRIESWILLMLIIAYVAFTFVIFYQAVIPSYEDGTTSWTFAVDSSVYVDIADSVREGRVEPWMLDALTTFPNTVMTPVAIAFILHSPLLEMIANYAVFTVSLVLLKRSYSISLVAFAGLLLLNPTTTTSLLCVNKEILDLFVLSLFLYSRAKGHRFLVFLALCFSLVNRWETCTIMAVFVLVQSRFNPLRRRRWATLSLLLLALNFVMPFWVGVMLSKRFEEAQFANLIALLDKLQMNYLYALVFVPKLFENLFAFLYIGTWWSQRSSWLYIMYFNNLANLILIVTLAIKRRLTIRNDLMFLAAIDSVIVAQSMAVQPRYFYSVYILLCLQATLKGDRIWCGIRLPDAQLEILHA